MDLDGMDFGSARDEP
jgi:hypothetical protein